MPWLSNWFYRITHKDFDLEGIKQKILTNTASSEDLLAYVDDLEYRVDTMIDELKKLYKKYDITFSGFKSFQMACDYLRESIKDGSEQAYNQLIKLESMVTSEQQRHLTLIKMAMTKNGQRVFDRIKQNPEDKILFDKVFGSRDLATGKVKDDGIYQRLWSEIHKLSEYILINKNRVYH